MIQATFLDWLDEPPPLALVPSAHPKLRWYQEEARDGILERLKEDDSTMAVMATGLGKCLGRDTPVLMYDGRVLPVQEIAIGDLLMGPDSRPRRVRSVSSGYGPLFRIEPIKGEPWVCNHCHVLTLKHTTTGAITDVPLDVYLAQNRNFKHLRKMFSVSVDFPAGAPLPVDPYIIGVWLGDGTKALDAFQVTKPDREIRDALCVFADSLGDQYEVGSYSSPNKCPTHVVRLRVRPGRGGSPLLRTMRELFPLAPHTPIPHSYLTASRAERLALLAGLLDTDGHYAAGCFEIVQRQTQLADGIAFLARSLGLRVTRATKTVNGTDYQRLVLSGDLSVIPTRLPRKQAKPRGQKKDALRTGFTVTPLEDGEFFGFTLDGDGRFLLGDFTVTHNTQVFCSVAEAWDGPVLVLAHRDELVRQAQERLESFLGEPVEVEQRESRASAKARVVVGSVQSICREKRLERLGKDRFSLVILDENHHAPAVTFRRVLEWFEGAKRLGVTATPDRADEKALGKLFKSVAYCMDITEGVEAGYLVPIRGRRVELGAIDISGVSVSGGDLVAGQLDEAMLRATEGIVKAVLEHEPDRQGIGFYPGIKTAQFAADRMNALRPNSAALVTAGTLLNERRDIVRDFKNGRLRYLFNVGVATEGFDAPNANLIIMGRPTKSRSLYAQMAGRGTRSAPGVVDGFPGREDSAARRQAIALSSKPDMVIMDFVGNSGRHSLVGPEDLLGGNYSDAEIAEAKKKESPGGDIRSALERARIELRRIAGVMKSTVTSKAMAFDPFSCMGIDRRQAQAAEQRFGYIPASDAQRSMLERAGLDKGDLDALSKQAASKLIGTMIKRRELGLANYSQLRALRRLGVATPTLLTARNAAHTIEYLATLRGMGADPDMVEGLLNGERQMGDDLR